MCSSGDKAIQNTENSQSDFSKTLQGAFSKQFGARSAAFDFLTKTLTNNINNPQGMSPEALAAARTQATERTAGDYSKATQAVNGQIAAHGGNGLPSGVDAQIRGGVAAAGAQEQSGLQNDITMQNEDLRQKNYWNSVQGLEGVTGQEDPTGLAGANNGAAESVANLGQAFQASKQSQLMGTIGGIVGGGLSGWATGGFKKPGG